VKTAYILIVSLLTIAAGCQTESKKTYLADAVNNLQNEKKQLTSQLQQATKENQQLQKQIKTLAGIDTQLKFSSLYDIQKIKIHKYTNLYDKDKDGKLEKLIVYIQPIDAQGDIVKSPAFVDVQLWDLNTESQKALLGEWHIPPQELKKLWFATLITIDYRLTFDVADKIKNFQKPLTVKVIFTDLLTGKVFNEQRVIKPQQ